MTNLERFEVWARENGRGSSLADAQEYCDRVNLAALQADIAERAAQQTDTGEETLASLTAWASTSNSYQALKGDY